MKSPRAFLKDQKISDFSVIKQNVTKEAKKTPKITDFSVINKKQFWENIFIFLCYCDNLLHHTLAWPAFEPSQVAFPE